MSAASNGSARCTVGFVIALLIGTIPGIVFVILVELNAAIAPRLPILWRR